MIIYVLACRRGGMLIITAPSHRTRISRGSVTKCEQRRRACRAVAGPIITPISDEGLATAARERLIDGRNEELTPAPGGKAGRREGQGEHRRDFVPGDSAPSRGALWFGISCDGVSSLSFVFRVRFLSQAYGVSWLGLSRSFCRMFPPLLRKNTSLDVGLIFFPFGRIPLSLIYVYFHSYFVPSPFSFIFSFYFSLFVPSIPLYIHLLPFLLFLFPALLFPLVSLPLLPPLPPLPLPSSLYKRAVSASANSPYDEWVYFLRCQPHPSPHSTFFWPLLQVPRITRYTRPPDRDKVLTLFAR